ncbi:jg5936 [Pararge aegeria aegeria]|uniref:Jg5936 protein n=1 Tax=Pararge aegeria aegeria TaxID=348720 RepID=A0A8S4RDI8_9NEOP|nr:jg5936 [Pararge aegeria aegeria]
MLIVWFLFSGVNSYRLPGSCEPGHFYEPSLMDCLACPANASLVTAGDGFGCSCEEHSIPIGVNRCRPCNITEVVTSDGISCVPRRCQSSAGRIACRKCPRDYISVTQNFDGSPMREVQCIKCARGYKAIDNRCVRCEACTCNKNEVIVKGKCIPKKYLLDRPKYTENSLHPDELLEIVKLEYLCTDTLTIAMAKHTSEGGFQILADPSKVSKACLPPIVIRIGEDFSVMRDKSNVGYLRLGLAIDVEYATPDSDTITSTLRVVHDMPNAGILQGLQICGGVLGVVMVLYGLVQWRGVIRRGGSYIAIGPLLASSVSDVLHFASLLSTLHALTAEAGTLGLTLPLSQLEENVIEALVYTCASLKASL